MHRIVLALAVPLALAAGKGDTLFTDYRSWQHVKSMVIPDKANGLYGFHHVYVEPKALAAYKAGKGYPEGSHLVVPFYEIKEEGGALHQGPLKMVAYMKREAAAKDTGGWRFGALDPDGKPMTLDVKAGCFNCHEPKKDREYVFSEWAAK